MNLKHKIIINMNIVAKKSYFKNIKDFPYDILH